MKKCILAIFCAASMAGCIENEIPIIAEVAKMDDVFKKTEVTLFVENNEKLGKYEPYSGVYLGAYMGNKDISDQDFLNSLDTDLAFKVFQYKGANSISLNEILQCIADKQTPYFKFLLTEKTSEYYYLIGDMKRMFNIPIFLELYPLTEDITDPQKYKKLYIETYNIIKKNAPNTVFVYSVDYNNIEDSLIFYPGDEYVDWIGLNVYMPKYKNDQAVDYSNLETKIDLWYQLFQEKKPLMISGLAISHYSSVDSTYTIAKTKDDLEFFYDDMIEKHPRIKAILYTDINNRDYGKEDDFRISINEDLISFTKELWGENVFLHQLVNENENYLSSKVSYTVPVHIYNDIYYVQDIYVKNIIDEEILNSIETFKDLLGNIYYPLKYITNSY